jgi:hypothetical protein
MQKAEPFETPEQLDKLHFNQSSYFFVPFSKWVQLGDSKKVKDAIINNSGLFISTLGLPTTPLFSDTAVPYAQEYKTRAELFHFYNPHEELEKAVQDYFDFILGKYVYWTTGSIKIATESLESIFNRKRNIQRWAYSSDVHPYNMKKVEQYISYQEVKNKKRNITNFYYKDTDGVYNNTEARWFYQLGLGRLLAYCIENAHQNGYGEANGISGSHREGTTYYEIRVQDSELLLSLYPNGFPEKVGILRPDSQRLLVRNLFLANYLRYFRQCPVEAINLLPNITKLELLKYFLLYNTKDTHSDLTYRAYSKRIPLYDILFSELDLLGVRISTFQEKNERTYRIRSTRTHALSKVERAESNVSQIVDVEVPGKILNSIKTYITQR